MEDDVVTQWSMLLIRILWKNGKKWLLYELWLCENKSIDHLLWDPGEWKGQIILTQGIVGKQILFPSTL